MVYSVEYEIENSIGKNFFTFEHEAKHFAIDCAYEGFNVLSIREFGKLIGRISIDGDMFYYERA